MDLHQGDVLTHIVIPGKDYQGYHGFYIKYSMRNAMDIATLSCSVVSRINPLKKVLEDVRITFGVAAPVPYRCAKTEEALRGMEIGEELYQKVEELVREEINPRDSWRASKAFRLQIGGEIAKRALKESKRFGIKPMDPEEACVQMATADWRRNRETRAEGECSQGNGDGSCSAGCPDNFRRKYEFKWKNLSFI